VKRLEEEKGKIQRQLDLREQEVLSLVKRCSDQEGKMRESTLLRSKNSEVQKEVEELRQAMARREQEGAELEETKRELEQYKEQLDNVKKDHDALADTLRNCLANINKLNNEKKEWEDERRRILNRAEVDLEKQRLEHVEEINELKVTLTARQDKIEKLEEFLKDKSMANLVLRKENAELTKNKKHHTNRIEGFEKQVAELSKGNKEKLRELQTFKEKETMLYGKLEQRDQQVSALESEIAQYMQRAMSTSETLEVLQTENEGMLHRCSPIHCQHLLCRISVHIVSTLLNLCVF
jgi:chromosome segregation ATPase